MSATLSVVMPVYNEAAHLPATIEALIVALAKTDFDAELVLVDDGSTDGSADVARAAVAGRLPLRVVSQPNRGRLEARRAGLGAATGEWVLLLDGRVRIEPGALAFLRRRIAEGDRVWTSHVHVETGCNVLATFWKLIAELAWAEYFDCPRTTSFGSDRFDRYPKGTTCFLAPRALLVDAIGAVRSRYADPRRANDDTPILRWIAAREPIHISPSFDVSYRARTTLRSFLAHSFHRGIVFLDGHGRRESRFFPAAVAFYPASALLAVATARSLRVGLRAACALSLAAAAVGLARRRSAIEIVSLAVVTPLYALAHGAGMWRGLTLMVLRGVRPVARL